MIGRALALLVPMLVAAGGVIEVPANREARVARLELEAAQSSSFYLVVDAPKRSAFLKIRGVVLRSFALEAIELGTLELGSRTGAAWADSVCDFKRARPRERREMKPSSEGGLDSVLSSEEVDPAPGYFDVVCVSNLSIRFVPRGRSGLRAWFDDRVAGSSTESQRLLRLRIRMNEDDYRDLHRALPEEGKILFVVPDDAKSQR